MLARAQINETNPAAFLQTHYLGPVAQRTSVLRLLKRYLYTMSSSTSGHIACRLIGIRVAHLPSKKDALTMSFHWTRPKSSVYRFSAIETFHNMLRSINHKTNKTLSHQTFSLGSVFSTCRVSNGTLRTLTLFSFFHIFRLHLGLFKWPQRTDSAFSQTQDVITLCQLMFPHTFMLQMVLEQSKEMEEGNWGNSAVWNLKTFWCY